MPKRTRKEAQDINQFASSIVSQTIAMSGETPKAPGVKEFGDRVLRETLDNLNNARQRKEAEKTKEVQVDLNDQNTVSRIMREMGRRGGLKGAATLNARLSPAQRKKSAQRAAQARWGKPTR